MRSTEPETAVPGVEQRLNSFIIQLRSEYAILDRMVYKNKNQHRRGSYFKYLIKVRRDVRLLIESVKLEEILVQCFYVINGKKPKQKVSTLERYCGGKYNFMERLLGAARLLEQSVEPMLKAASKISILLAQSFFMSFSVTVLAIIARLRVLVQQILLDVVLVFNTVSSISHQRQSIKTIQGVEAFREYYPIHGDMITLECVWETDKLLLIRGIEKVEIKPQVSSMVKYLSIEAFRGDDEPGTKMADLKDMDIASMITNNPFSTPSTDYKQNIIDGSPSRSQISLKRKIDSTSRRAFVSVKKPTPLSDDSKYTLMQIANSSRGFI